MPAATVVAVAPVAIPLGVVAGLAASWTLLLGEELHYGVFDGTLLQVIKHLIAGEAVLAGYRPGLFEV